LEETCEAGLGIGYYSVIRSLASPCLEDLQKQRFCFVVGMDVLDVPNDDQGFKLRARRGVTSPPMKCALCWSGVQNGAYNHQTR